MASVNKVILIGNLGRDPEVRVTPDGLSICSVSLATSFTWKDKNTGERREETEWHRISFFNRLAEVAGQYLKKGSSIYVEGRLKTRKYTDKDNIERYVTDIIAENMTMLGARSDNYQEGTTHSPAQANTRSANHSSGFSSSTPAPHAGSHPAPADGSLPSGKPNDAPRPSAPATANKDIAVMEDDIPF